MPWCPRSCGHKRGTPHFSMPHWSRPIFTGPDPRQGKPHLRTPSRRNHPQRGGDDGVDGLLAIKGAGGITIAQDPAEATHPVMPHSAILFDHVDLVLPAAAIAHTIFQLARGETLPLPA